MNLKNIAALKKEFDLDVIIGLDFETFYDSKDKYSLRSQKMSTSEYVRDQRFKAQCVGIQTDKQRKARWYPHEKLDKPLQEIDWSRAGLLCHNNHFDGFILSQHFGIVPKMYFCSMSMARPLFSYDIGAGLDEVAKYCGLAGKVKADALKATNGIRDLPKDLMKKLGEYCADDVQDMWRIFKFMLPHFPIIELILIDITIRAFASPVVEVDHALAQEELDEQIVLKEKIFKSCIKYFPEAKKLKPAERLEYVAKQLSSNNKFAEALRSVNVEPPIKESPSDPDKEIYAFAKDDLGFQALQAHRHKRVRQLVEARLLAKSPIGETRARRMLLRGTTGDHKLPLLLNYGKARTLRWTGGDKFNPQNFPAARGGNKGRLRKAIIAPKGYKIVVVDSSQIEARMNAWLWDQDDLLNIFATGGDPYAVLASDIYGFNVNKDDNPDERFVGKVGVLGLGYQMGAPKFQNTLEVGMMGPPMIISERDAQKAVKTYRKNNYKIVAGWKFLDNMISEMILGNREIEHKNVIRFRKGAVDTVSGFSLMYPGLRRSYNDQGEPYGFTYKIPRGRTNLYGGKFNENIVQHLARLVVAEQMVDIAERYRIITMTHDEVVYLAKNREAEKAYRYGLKCMRQAPAWCPDIPLDGEGGFADNYSK